MVAPALAAVVAGYVSLVLSWVVLFVDGRASAVCFAAVRPAPMEMAASPAPLYLPPAARLLAAASVAAHEALAVSSAPAICAGGGAGVVAAVGKAASGALDKPFEGMSVVCTAAVVSAYPDVELAAGALREIVASQRHLPPLLAISLA